MIFEAFFRVLPIPTEQLHSGNSSSLFSSCSENVAKLLGKYLNEELEFSLSEIADLQPETLLLKLRHQIFPRSFRRLRKAVSVEDLRMTLSLWCPGKCPLHRKKIHLKNLPKKLTHEKNIPCKIAYRKLSSDVTGCY